MNNKFSFKFAATLTLATTLVLANPSYCETLNLDLTASPITAAIAEDLSGTAPDSVTIDSITLTGTLAPFEGVTITSNADNTPNYVLDNDLYNSYYSLTNPTTTEDDTLDSVTSFSNEVFYNREYKWDRTKELSITSNVIKYTDVTNNKTATGNNTSLGDTIALLNQNTTGKSVSTTNASDTYTATANFGAAQGTFTLTGAKSGDTLSKVDFDNNYTGFELNTSGTKVNVNNIEFINAKTSEGSVLNISNGGAGADINNVKISQTGDLISNYGALKLDGTNNIQANIKGNGTTTINSGETTVKSIAQGTLNTVSGAKLYSSNIEAGDINNAGTIEIEADNLKSTNAIDNSGTIIYTQGTTQSNIKTGSTGEVQINTTSYVTLNNALAGTLNLAKGNLKLGSAADLTNVASIKAAAQAALDLQDGTYNTTDISALQDGSILNVLIDASANSGSVDTFTSSNSLSATVYIKSIALADYLTGELPIELSVAGNDNVKSAIDIASDFSVVDTANLGNIEASYSNGKVTLKSSTLADAVKSKINKITYTMSNNENISSSLGALNGSELDISGGGKTIQGSADVDGISLTSSQTLKLTDTKIAGFNNYAIQNGGNLELEGTNTIGSKITGDGTANVNSGKTTLGANLAQTILKIFKGAELETTANNIQDVVNDITNDGTLTLTSGDNAKNIKRTDNTQDAIINIKGTVTNAAKLTQNEVNIVSGSMTNKSGGTIEGGTLTNNAALTNEGTITSKVNNYSTFENKNAVVDVDNYAGTFTNTSSVTGTAENKASGAKIENKGGTIANVKNILGGIVNNITGTITNITNNATVTNDASIGTITNNEGAALTNKANITGSLDNKSTLASNSGTISG
ncbi:hypothetical protein IJ531_05000, partial [bacterium]|nr:hypothetical protein [bacterium]